MSELISCRGAERGGARRESRGAMREASGKRHETEYEEGEEGEGRGSRGTRGY